MRNPSPPPLRRMFDVINDCPWHTRELRTDHLAETLVARGMTRADADALAAETYAACGVCLYAGRYEGG